MYLLKDRVDALTTFMPALVEDVVYLLEVFMEYYFDPTPETARRISISSLAPE